ncbi:MAG TPA: GNAT family protein [Flavisolibacter sp.]|nr:GNAT family protein [Flavisolibacter sp.]
MHVATEQMIQTDRLLLKGISPAVIHDLFLNSSEEVIKAFFGVDEKGYLHYKEMHEKGMDTHRFSLFFFLIIERSTNIPIGECGFHTWNSTHRRAELFYLLRNDTHKRKGYMKEALPHVISHGFEVLHLHRIEALIDEANTPSLKLLRGTGFQLEGIMREDYVVNGQSVDSHCYSLLKHEWSEAGH